MKNIVLAAAFVGAASIAHAGSMAEPEMEMPVIVEEVEEPRGFSWVVPALLVAVIAAFAA